MLTQLFDQSMKRILLPALLLLFMNPLLLYAQMVKGVIVDKDTKETLAGANIILLDYEPLIGTSSNADGYFELNNLPPGRHSFQVTYLGYQPNVVSEVLVVGGKETFLTIELSEEIFEGV